MVGIYAASFVTAENASWGLSPACAIAVVYPHVADRFADRSCHHVLPILSLAWRATLHLTVDRLVILHTWTHGIHGLALL